MFSELLNITVTFFSLLFFFACFSPSDGKELISINSLLEFITERGKKKGMESTSATYSYVSNHHDISLLVLKLANVDLPCYNKSTKIN